VVLGVNGFFVGVAVCCEELFEFPAEAAGLVLVDRLEHEKNGSDGEEGAAYEGCDATCGPSASTNLSEHAMLLTSCTRFVGKFRSRIRDGEPVEETTGDEDGTANGEEERN
jgi:hypothetical protein